MTEPELNPLALRLAELADRTAAQVLAILEQVAQGLVSLDAVPELAAVVAELGGVQAAALTTAELELVISSAVGRPVSLPEPGSFVDGQKIQAAAATVVAGPADELEQRLARLARSVVARAGQDAREQGIRSSPAVEGWTRGLDSKSCELCGWWWREGRVWPKSHHMPRHPGCTCVQVPVIARDIAGLSREAYDDSAERRQLEQQGQYLAAFGTDRRHNNRRT